MFLFISEKNIDIRFRGISGLNGLDELLICSGQKYPFNQPSDSTTMENRNLVTFLAV